MAADQIINGTWARAAHGWDDRSTLEIYVNLRRADALVAKYGGRHGYHIAAVFGMAPGADGGIQTVPLDITARSRADIEHTLREVATATSEELPERAEV